jgi:MFS family permease
MPIVFWTIVVGGFLAGALLSICWGRMVLNRIASDSERPQSVRRAGRIAGFVAAIPSLLLGLFFGGNLGGAVAANFAARLAENGLAQHVTMGLGIGLGAMFVLCLLIVSTIAAATFMKVHLAKEPDRK